MGAYHVTNGLQQSIFGQSLHSWSQTANVILDLQALSKPLQLLHERLLSAVCLDVRGLLSVVCLRARGVTRQVTSEALHMCDRQKACKVKSCKWPEPQSWNL